MSYKAPLEDMNFLINQVFNIDQQLKDIPAFADFDQSLYAAVLEESAKFSENVLYPLNRNGDEQGCQFIDGKVTTPEGFKQAYKSYGESGWQGVSGDPEYGGQGLPKTINLLTEEMVYSSNTSFCLYSSLTNGAYQAIRAHGSDSVKSLYLPAMLEGRWTGAMGLTEPHAGSDLGIIRSKAEPTEAGNYLINGTKIFITGGDQDLTENIIHLVLAKLPDAPEGAKGISLFLVPKIKVLQNGNLGEPNGVSCGSIEHKMGIKASATCVMNFDNAEGLLIGEKNQGLTAMFTMMNLERLSIGVQGIGLAETSYQLSKNYALERKQGKNALGQLTNIIGHADIRRMLLSQRAYTEAGRALSVYMGIHLDKQYHHPDDKIRQQSAGMTALLTPIAKSFFTDTGYQSCNFGLQILGGHGYVREWGLEQLVRDAKIAQIYEGTNGIQALDFMLRKVVFDKQNHLQHLLDLIQESLGHQSELEQYEALKQQTQNLLQEVASTSQWLRQEYASRGYELQGGATSYLNAVGHLVYAWMWLEMLKSLENQADSEFKSRKLIAASFYNQQLLPIAFEQCRQLKQGYQCFVDIPDNLI